jgi:hypothetical protein
MQQREERSAVAASKRLLLLLDRHRRDAIAHATICPLFFHTQSGGFPPVANDDDDVDPTKHVLS